MIVHKEKCNPQGCGGYLCMRVSPSNRAGKEAIVKDKDGKVKVNEEVISDADKIAANKCPFDALEMINLPEELERDPIHRYLPNGFSLYSIPVPLFNNVVGIIGRNGIGKSTALKIVAGLLEPNFGEEDSGGFEDLAEAYKGTEAQAFFEDLAKQDIQVAMKPQHVDLIPKQFQGNTKELLQGVDERGVFEEVVEGLSLRSVLDRDVSKLSGGELQRVAIGATISKDADLYLFDEPTSYLDVKQRVEVSKFIQRLNSEDRAVIAIEHDLIILDYLTDIIHVMYGEQGGYGVCSLGKTSKAGINMYLEGFIAEENMRFRDKKIRFEKRSKNRSETSKTLVSWDAFSHAYPSFTLDATGGVIKEKDVVGVLGENGIGKSTFMKVLSGEIEKDMDLDADISYKPQHLPETDELVRLYLQGVEKHVATIMNPLDIEPLLDSSLNELSGGQRQRVEIARCLLEDADLYLFDEPSAYLDVEQRLAASKAIKNCMEQRSKAAIVIDHDVLFIDYISNKLLTFEGVPGETGEASGPFTMEEGMNKFLEELGITFRRDIQNNRPRINKPGSQKDKEQKRKGKYYYA